MVSFRMILSDFSENIQRHINFPQDSVKGKGKCIYIALIFVLHARRSGMDRTVLPAITPMPAFTS